MPSIRRSRIVQRLRSACSAGYHATAARLVAIRRSLLCSHVRRRSRRRRPPADGHGHQARVVRACWPAWSPPALMFPVVGGFGLMSNRASDVVANGSAQLVEGEVPAVSTMVDAKGNPIAWLYTQRRFEVPQRPDRQHDEAGDRLHRGQAVCRAQRRRLEGHADRPVRLRVRRPPTPAAARPSSSST